MCWRICQQMESVAAGKKKSKKSRKPEAAVIKPHGAKQAPDHVVAGDPEANRSERNPTVMEIFEFAKSLSIDPATESEMLWIAEEAFSTQLPPGWQRTLDKYGRWYFYNSASNESSWEHPLYSVFKDAVMLWRGVKRTSDFQEVEENLHIMEQQTQKDASEWIQLFDAHGARYYHNKRTEEQSFVDPRSIMYHELHICRHMVATMKLHLPLPAQKSQPRFSTEEEEMLQRRSREEEEQRYIDSVIQIQAWARGMSARHRVQSLRDKCLIAKGDQPLKHRLQLRWEDLPDCEKEVVLSEDTTHRYYKAAQKLQARARGMRSRAEVVPIMTHAIFVNRQARTIQKTARVYIAAKKSQRIKEERVTNAACRIQSMVRARKARIFVQGFRSERAQYDFKKKHAIKIQSIWRMILAVRLIREKRAAHKDVKMAFLQAKLRSWLAQCYLTKCHQENEPLVFRMMRSTDPDPNSLWTWQLIMLPVNEEGSLLARPHHYTNLFSKVNASTWELEASVKIQKAARGKAARKRVKVRADVMDWLAGYLVDASCDFLESRIKSSIKIQALARGHMERQRGRTGERYLKCMQRVASQIKQSQLYFRCYLAQKWLVSLASDAEQEIAAKLVQARWRGHLARHQVAVMNEEALWPMKGFFQYTATGDDSVRVDVQFFANPRFDGFKHFRAYGDYGELEYHEYHRQHSKTRSSAKSKRSKKAKAKHTRKSDDECSHAGSETPTPSSRRWQSKEHYSQQHQDAAPSSEDPPSFELGAAEVGQAAVPEDVALLQAQEPEPELDIRADEAEPPTANLEKIAEKISAIGPLEWSPRRGPLLSPGAAARERAEKQRPPTRDHPSAPEPFDRVASRGDLLSPMTSLLSPKGAGPFKNRQIPSRPDSPSALMPLIQSRSSHEEAMLAGVNGIGSRSIELQQRSASLVHAQQLRMRKGSCEDLSVQRPPPQSALQVLQYAAEERAISASSGTHPPLKLQRVHTASTATSSHDDAEVRRACDIQEERKYRVNELMHREKKHQALRRKLQMNEAKELGEVVSGSTHEQQQKKAKELKRWLKIHDAKEKAAKKKGISPRLLKLEQERIESRERRARIADQKREILFANRPLIQDLQKTVHRQRHHHIHQHEGVLHDSGQRLQTAPADSGIGGLVMRTSFSAIDFRCSSAGADMVPRGMVKQL